MRRERKRNRERKGESNARANSQIHLQPLAEEAITLGQKFDLLIHEILTFQLRGGICTGVRGGSEQITGRGGRGMQTDRQIDR